MLFCFFFSSRRRHTRSLCDWSSDVCSSDLVDKAGAVVAGVPAPTVHVDDTSKAQPVAAPPVSIKGRGAGKATLTFRSEERRVGKEWRCRWSTDHDRKKKQRDVWTDVDRSET